MNIICPECMGSMIPNNNQAVCQVHGGKYDILFSRNTIASESDSDLRKHADSINSDVNRHCIKHPNVAGEYKCKYCGSNICQTCDFLQNDGSHVCPDCITGASSTETLLTQDITCAYHNEVQASRYCSVCNTPICHTCDFEFPGNIHLCKDCAIKPNKAISGNRKKYLIWSYILAIWTSIGTVIFLAICAEITDPIELEAVGIVFSFIVMIPSLIGTALGFSSFDKRLSNPLSIWIATIWNSLVMLLLILMTIVGVFMG